MKIQFPLWVVHDPTPVSELVDVRWQARDFAHLENVLLGGGVANRRLGPRNPVFYTDETEATADAQARLAARDAADNAGWIPLADLRCGAVFETQNGVKGTKIAWLADGRVDWIGVDGARPFTSGDILVREV